MLTLFLQPFKRGFDFSGRSSRSEFWIIILPLTLLYYLFLFGIVSAIVHFIPKMINNPNLLDTVKNLLSVENVLEYRKEVLLETHKLLDTFSHEMLFFNILPYLALTTATKMFLFGSHFYILSFFYHAFILSLIVRRLHDTNRSAWWALILLLPFVGTICFIILMLLKGTKGNNKYGTEPNS